MNIRRYNILDRDLVQSIGADVANCLALYKYIMQGLYCKGVSASNAEEISALCEPHVHDLAHGNIPSELILRYCT